LVLLVALAGCTKTQEAFKLNAPIPDERCTYSVTTVQYGVECPDVEVWIENLDNGRIRVTETMYHSVVEVDAETLLPKSGEVDQRSGDAGFKISETFTDDRKVQVVNQGPLSTTEKTVELTRPGYHFHSLMLLFRAVELRSGNTIRFRLYSPYVQDVVRARIRVEGSELMQVDGKSVEVYRLRGRFLDYKMSAGVAKEPPHRLLRFTNGVVDLRLKSCE
jgi:hypothetical protein